MAHRCLVVADFNAANLAGYLNNEQLVGGPELAAHCAPFGQVRPVLLAPQPEACDLLVIWTTPDGELEGFRRLLAGDDVADADLDAEVDQFADLVLRSTTWAGCVLVASWALPASRRGYGMLEWKPGVGLRSRLARLNLRLAERVAADPRVFVLDASRWLEAAGRYADNAKLWHLGKIPYGHEVFRAAAADLRAAYAGLRGQARKLVVLDLDDTLWGGIVGDVGWENLQLGGHDAVGEAFVAFQRELKALTRRGVILAVVSKNDEEVALTAIRNHPEMVLREEDLAGWRINWHDKADNVLQVVGDLNLGLQSVVFIDDNPAERARVAETFPEVLVPDWPADPLLYGKALRELTCFDAPALTGEDRERTGMYVADRQRRDLQERLGTPEDWLASLNLQVTLAPIAAENLPRAAQLLNKSNQLNLTTRRVSEAELAAWAAAPEVTTWTLRVADRFGDAGLTGVVTVQQADRQLRVVDFVLSCRVFGRRIEHLMLSLAVAEAQRRGCDTVVAEYLPTAKNKPTLEFLEASGMSSGADRLFTWPTTNDYLPPSHLDVMKTGRIAT